MSSLHYSCPRIHQLEFNQIAPSASPIPPIILVTSSSSSSSPTSSPLSLFLYITTLFTLNAPHHHNPREPLVRYRMNTTQISESEQRALIEKLDIFKIKGRDKRGRTIIRIIGKFFPARMVSVDVLSKYLEDKIFPELENKPFAMLYVHTGVQRSENFPGISALRSIYDAIPVNVKRNLEAVYFLHPGLQARLFLATFGRFLFTGGVYGKLKYVSRLDYLWEHVRRSEIEVPDFVYDHDEDLEHRPMMDYGLESDHPRVYDAPAVDPSVSMYSMRCIS